MRNRAAEAPHPVQALAIGQFDEIARQPVVFLQAHKKARENAPLAASSSAPVDRRRRLRWFAVRLDQREALYIEAPNWLVALGAALDVLGLSPPMRLVAEAREDGVIEAHDTDNGTVFQLFSLATAPRTDRLQPVYDRISPLRVQSGDHRA